MKVNANVIAMATLADNKSACELSDTLQGDPIKCHGS